MACFSMQIDCALKHDFSNYDDFFASILILVHYGHFKLAVKRTLKLYVFLPLVNA